MSDGAEIIRELGIVAILGMLFIGIFGAAIHSDYAKSQTRIACFKAGYPIEKCEALK